MVAMKELERLKNYLSAIGSDLFRVQGAGGNASVKLGNVLWGKASGTRLKEANTADVLIPMDLTTNKSSDGRLNQLGYHHLRPSIELGLHEELAWPVVLHLHQLSSLPALLLKNPIVALKNVMNDQFSWGLIEYRRPGEALTSALVDRVQRYGLKEVYFLQNHGVIIGGDSVSEVSQKVDALDEIFDRANMVINSRPLTSLQLRSLASLHRPDYEPCTLSVLHHLSTDPSLVAAMKRLWAITPDHVVFLGSEPVFESASDAPQARISRHRTPFIFVEGYGTLQREDVRSEELEQLHSYAIILQNLTNLDLCSELSKLEAASLLDWEAEKFRQKQASESSGAN